MYLYSTLYSSFLSDINGHRIYALFKSWCFAVLSKNLFYDLLYIILYIYNYFISKHLFYWVVYHGKFKGSALETIINYVERKQAVCMNFSRGKFRDKVMYSRAAATSWPTYPIKKSISLLKSTFYEFISFRMQKHLIFQNL